MKYLSTLKPVTPIIFVSLISACGGGGGGDSSPSPAPEVCNSWLAGAYTQQFNEYLPITEGANINYSNGTHDVASSTFTYNQSESTEQGTDVYDIRFQGTETGLTLVTSSTPDEILLYGVDGPIELSISGLPLDVDSLRFENDSDVTTPITLYSGINGSTTANTDASARISSGIFYGDIDISVEYTIVVGDGDLVLNNGTLPTKDLDITLEITVPPIAGLTTDPIVILLNSPVALVKGIGFAEAQFSFGGIPLLGYGRLGAIMDLPLPIWFDNNNPNPPTIATGSDATFQTINGNISAHDYTIANLAELNDNEWVNIQENTSCSYDIELTNGAGMPTELTSLEIVFEDRSGDRMSGNITLQ